MATEILPLRGEARGQLLLRRHRRRYMHTAGAQSTSSGCVLLA